MDNIKNFKIFLYLIIVSVCLLVFKLYYNPNYQNALVYYLSASLAPLSLSTIQISSSDINHFTSLGNSVAGSITMEKYVYKFSEVGKGLDVVEIVNTFGYMVSIGFLAYIKFTKFLFNFLGDVQGIVLANMCIHILASIVLISSIKKNSHSVLFTFLYAFNPFIIYIVSFPYYYYATVIPGIVAIYLYEKKFEISNIFLLAFMVLLLFSIFLRSTLLFGVLIIFIFSLSRKNFISKVLLGSLFLGFLLYFYSNNTLIYGPWHTAYIGIGAYPNAYDIRLNDSSSMEYLLKTLNISVFDFQALNVETRQELWKSRVIELLILDPFVFLSNAIKNLLQLYGLGYSTKYYIFHYFSMIVGLIFLAFSFKYKLYFHIWLILFLNLGYVLYFPPIPMYMAGSYLILVHAWSKIVEKFIH